MKKSQDAIDHFAAVLSARSDEDRQRHHILGLIALAEAFAMQESRLADMETRLQSLVPPTPMVPVRKVLGQTYRMRTDKGL